MFCLSKPICISAQSDQCISFLPAENVGPLATNRVGMCRLIPVFYGRTCQLVPFAGYRLK